MPTAKTVLTAVATMVVSVAAAMSINHALAGPSAAPPYNNVSSPLNVSINSQVKKGPLGLGNLRSDSLGGNQLYVKGTTKLEGATTVVGSTTVTGATRLEGSTNVVGDTSAYRFCLPSNKGGCADDWNRFRGVAGYADLPVGSIAGYRGQAHAGGSAGVLMIVPPYLGNTRELTAIRALTDPEKEALSNFVLGVIVENQFSQCAEGWYDLPLELDNSGTAASARTCIRIYKP